jgi:hypothetical protein
MRFALVLAFMVVCVAGCDRKSASTQPVAESSLKIVPFKTEPNAGPPKVEATAVVATPGKAIPFEDLSVTVTAVVVGNVPLIDYERKFDSKEPETRFLISIKNNSETRKVNYLTWRGPSSGAELSDNHGNIYKRIDFGLVDIVGAAKRNASIHPAETISDVIVFERLVDKATSVTITMKGKNVGAKEDLRLTFNKADWNNFKP